MRLFCWYCFKSVSSELPNNTLVRAIAVCPECIAQSTEAAKHPLSPVAPPDLLKAAVMLLDNWDKGNLTKDIQRLRKVVMAQLAEESTP